MKDILLINDMPGYGRVALSCMIPVLSNKGKSVFNLPTAVVSNTLDYGKFAILDWSKFRLASIGKSICLFIASEDFTIKVRAFVLFSLINKIM